MAAPTSTFEIRILRRDAGESRTDEAVVVIDGRDELSWCTALGDDDVEVGAMLGGVGDEDRSILSSRFARDDGESAESLADRVVAYLGSGAMLTDPLVTRRPISSG